MATAKSLTHIISIHVPREGHDQILVNRRRRTHISIHVPREGHDTRCCPRGWSQPPHFNPRAPRGARQLQGRLRPHAADFNPRAPRGARPAFCPLYAASAAFQSTCPARGTTWLTILSFGATLISIHVPREGHDTEGPGFIWVENISIHVPREGHDTARCGGGCWTTLFQSTCPARGTTRGWGDIALLELISIHVPREGHDQCTRRICRGRT